MLNAKYSQDCRLREPLKWCTSVLNIWSFIWLGSDGSFRDETITTFPIGRQFPAQALPNPFGYGLLSLLMMALNHIFIFWKSVIALCLLSWGRHLTYLSVILSSRRSCDQCVACCCSLSSQLHSGPLHPNVIYSCSCSSQMIRLTNLPDLQLFTLLRSAQRSLALTATHYYAGKVNYQSKHWCRMWNSSVRQDYVEKKESDMLCTHLAN